MKILVCFSGHPDFKLLQEQINVLQKYGELDIVIGTVNCLAKKHKDAGSFATAYTKTPMPVEDIKAQLNGINVKHLFIDDISTHNLEAFVPWVHQWYLFERATENIDFSQYDYVIRSRPDNIIVSDLVFNHEVQVSYRYEFRPEIRKIVASDQFIIMPATKTIRGFFHYYNQFNHEICIENSQGKHSLHLISEVKLAEFLGQKKISWSQDNIKVYPDSWIQREPNSPYSQDVKNMRKK